MGQQWKMSWIQDDDSSSDAHLRFKEKIQKQSPSCAEGSKESSFYPPILPCSTLTHAA